MLRVDMRGGMFGAGRQGSETFRVNMPKQLVALSLLGKMGLANIPLHQTLESPSG